MKSMRVRATLQTISKANTHIYKQQVVNYVVCLDFVCYFDFSYIIPIQLGQKKVTPSNSDIQKSPVINPP